MGKWIHGCTKSHDITTKPKSTIKPRAYFMCILYERIDELICVSIYQIYILISGERICVRLRISYISYLTSRRCAPTCWGSWSEYGTCSDPCGTHGYQTSTRQVSPPSDCVSWVARYGCQGSSSRTRACNRMCHNGGTPRDGWCSCTAWYQGTCCETREILFNVARHHHLGKRNISYHSQNVPVWWDSLA